MAVAPPHRRRVRLFPRSCIISFSPPPSRRDRQAIVGREGMIGSSTIHGIDLVRGSIVQVAG
jgi:hypothetical protein